jgi:CBS domain containing-hemolysin-like protein
VGEKVYFQDLKMTILEADKRRIRRLLVERKDPPFFEASVDQPIQN